MEIIKSIKIRKFRSIKSVTKNKGIELTDLNVFVGQNDQGKSNILKALNLFFNKETDRGSPFRFLDDYCYHSGKGKGTAHNIQIDLVIHPPKGRFKHAKPLLWVKKWRKDGSVNETKKYIESKKSLSQTDNVSQWLEKIRYRYIPAIKGQDYFSSLMRQLHDVLNEVHSDLLSNQGEGFIGGIQKVTNDITNNLAKQIKIANTIQVPSDFKQLFSTLDFGEQIDNNIIRLKQRGDGIKTRHIPIILKYMSEEEQRMSQRGYVTPDTIWGFEEPENNLELKYAYELAEVFKEYSKDIQILVTTHSPAFYSLDTEEGDGVNTFYVSQDKEHCTIVSKILHGEKDDLHEPMGLLPIIAPYLRDIYSKDKEIEELENKLDNLKSDTKCIVLTEDEQFKNLKIFFGINGFNNDQTEYFSYKGSGNLDRSTVLIDYLKKENQGIHIIVHRDSDYLTKQELKGLEKKIKSKGAYLFLTTGVDIESQYLNYQHILELYPAIEVKNILEEATNECEEDSMKRLQNKHLQEYTGSDYTGEITKLKNRYQENKERYRYGKKVLNKVISKIQQKIEGNPNIIRKTDHIQLPLLKSIASKIWQ